MKRKLRLLVAVVLTLAMVMGMSVTALAAECIESVEIDFANSNVAGATWNQIKQVMTITADSKYNIKIVQSGIMDDDEGPISDDAKLEAGRPYTLCLLLQSSSGYEFKTVSTSSPVPVSCIINNVKSYDKMVWVCTDMTGTDPIDSDHGKYLCVMISFIAESSTPDPDPTPTSVKKGTLEMVAVDHDTFKSEAPSKTVIASNMLGANSFFDLKVHAADDRTKANQAFLVQNYIGANAKILLTENIYPGRDLSTIENGSLQTLTFNNLPKNQAGPVYSVVYNQTDKAYVISGTLDANGTAVFTGFKLRPASTITICK